MRLKLFNLLFVSTFFVSLNLRAQENNFYKKNIFETAWNFNKNDITFYSGKNGMYNDITVDILPSLKTS